MHFCNLRSYLNYQLKFKKNTNDVKAPSRVEEVINKVKNLAKTADAYRAPGFLL